MLEPPGGGPGAKVALQRSQVQPQDHPWIHLDLHVADAAEQQAEVARLVSIGAERVAWDSYPDTPEGITAYRRRGHLAETPHGQIKHNLGFRQLSLRGHAKAAAEWRFACTVHNLLKAITTGHLTPQALATLTP